jgi:hypothetical protein
MPTRKLFNPLSTLALVVSLMATWEGFLAAMGAGLTSGGPVSLVYGFIGLSSMCPTCFISSL